MLRWTIAVLLAANSLYFAWTQGHLAAIGFPPTSEPREPQRLTQQIAPENVRLLNGPRGAEPPTAPAPAPESAGAAATPAAATPAAANEPRACWQASGFSPEQAELLRAELRLLGLGGGDWQLTETRSPGRWIVYMGRYDSAEQASRKKAELRAMGVEFRDVNTNGLAPGIALGTFSSEEAASEGLQLAERRNVRTARVVQERAESLSYSLRLPAIGEAVRARIEALGPAMAGRSLQRCN